MTEIKPEWTTHEPDPKLIHAILAAAREMTARAVDLTEPTDDDLGEYPVLRCAVYGSPRADS